MFNAIKEAKVQQPKAPLAKPPSIAEIEKSILSEQSYLGDLVKYYRSQNVKESLEQLRKTRVSTTPDPIAALDEKIAIKIWSEDPKIQQKFASIHRSRLMHQPEALTKIVSKTLTNKQQLANLNELVKLIHESTQSKHFYTELGRRYQISKQSEQRIGALLQTINKDIASMEKTLAIDSLNQQATRKLAQLKKQKIDLQQNLVNVQKITENVQKLRSSDPKAVDWMAEGKKQVPGKGLR
jgi:hypothetical protein